MDEGQKEAVPRALSPAHSIALVARMLTLEEDCRQIERFLEGYEGIFYAYPGVFPYETRGTIRTLLSGILHRISRIRSDLGLPQRQMEIDQMLAAHLSQMWVTLHESKASSLHGYGVVPDELEVYLEARVEELLSLVASLRSTIESRKRPLSGGAGEDKTR